MMSGADAREQAARPAVPQQAAGEQARPAPPGGAVAASRGRPRLRRWLAAIVVGVVVVVAAGAAGAVWLGGGFRGSGSPGSGASAGGYPTSTALVSRRTLISQMAVDGTLGYAGSYTVTGKSAGVITWLPAVGQVIRQGQVVYEVNNGIPVVLLRGPVPAWRTLKEGMTGADVAQLNHDLVALGYASSTDVAALGWDYFSWETRYGLQRLQSALGITSPSGVLTLGTAVFEPPTAIRVTGHPAQLGGQGSGPILAATSTRHVVIVGLDASDQSEVKKGDRVLITLPDGTNTPGVISSVGSVATGSGANAKITVTVRLERRAAGRLDQVPVTVYITTSRLRDALVVPVAALLARSSGGYAVEVVSGRRHYLVPVSTGQFDDAAGLVQVSGSLVPGERVVVPGV